MSINQIIIGGSHGIGLAYLQKQSGHACVNLSRTKPEIDGVDHHEVDILKDDLPDLEAADALLYFPGSINLKPFTSLSEDVFQSDFDINVVGAVRAIKKYLPLLKKADTPSITLFSTVAVGQGMPFHASVAAAKGAVEGLVRALAAEWAPKIRVNAIAINLTDTPLAEKILRNDKARENIAERQPMKRIMHAEEVADAAHFVVHHAPGMTGQVMGLDLGLSTLRP